MIGAISKMGIALNEAENKASYACKNTEALESRSNELSALLEERALLTTEEQKECQHRFPDFEEMPTEDELEDFRQSKMVENKKY